MDPPLPELSPDALPKALLPVKLEYSIVPLTPSQYTDPPAAHAVLFTNSQLDT